MDARLVVQYTPERKDYIRASRLLAVKSRWFMLIAGIIILAVIASLVIILISSIGDESWRNIALVILLVGVFYIIYYLVFIPLQLSGTYKSNEYLQKERKISFSDSEITLKVEKQVSKLDWEKIEYVVNGNDLYLLIYIAEQRVYPFVPKRAFEAEGSEALFRSLLEEKGIPVR